MVIISNNVIDVNVCTLKNVVKENLECLETIFHKKRKIDFKELMNELGF